MRQSYVVVSTPVAWKYLVDGCCSWKRVAIGDNNDNDDVIVKPMTDVIDLRL